MRWCKRSSVPVTLEDAARLGRRLAQCAGTGAARRGEPACSWSPCMAARAASSTKAAPIGRRCAPSRTPSRSRSSSMATSQSFDDADAALGGIGRRRGDGRPRRAGQAVVSRPAGALSRDRRARGPRRRSASSSRLISALYGEMLAHHGIASACATRESISAGRSTPPPRARGRRGICSRRSAAAC